LEGGWRDLAVARRPGHGSEKLGGPSTGSGRTGFMWEGPGAAVNFSIAKERDHEVVEGRHPIERGTPLRLAYGQPPPLAGEDGLAATIVRRLTTTLSFPGSDWWVFQS